MRQLKIYFDLYFGKQCHVGADGEAVSLSPCN